MKKLALLLSLPALGALGLVACGGNEDDETTAASGTETARDRVSCGDIRVSGRPFPLVEVAVVEGDVPCRRARRVMEDLYHGRVDDLVASEPYLGEIALVGSWRCGGLDGLKSCKKAVRTPSAKKITARAPIDEGGQTPDPTEASETETTNDALAADSKSCGAYERWRLAVIRGMSCREARRVIHDYVYGRPTPDGWICDGGDHPVECRSEAGGTIRAPVRNAVLRRWEAAEAS